MCIIKEMVVNYLCPEGVLSVALTALRAMYYTQIHDHGFWF